MLDAGNKIANFHGTVRPWQWIATCWHRGDDNTVKATRWQGTDGIIFLVGRRSVGRRSVGRKYTDFKIKNNNNYT